MQINRAAETFDQLLNTSDSLNFCKHPRIVTEIFPIMTQLNQDSQNLAEIIDRLISVPVFSGSSLAARPVVIDLYEAARQKFGRPLCFDATERLLSSVKKAEGKTSSNVLFMTGFIVPPWLEAETDGPIGTATLSRSLNLGLDLTPVIVTEKSAVPKTRSLLECAGFRTADWNAKDLKERKRTAYVIEFTTDSTRAKSEAEKLVSEVEPTSIISIEKAAPNRFGVFHSGVGVDVSPLCSKVGNVMESAKNSGIPTIGVGDAGNEIGMGAIEDTVRRVLPTGSECGCPCHGGVASAVSTDSLIVTGTSNWGAYAIEALLSFHMRVPELLHDAAMEEYLITRAAGLGFIDPASGFADAGVDAIPARVHASLVDVLNFATKSRFGDSYYIKKYKEYTRDKSRLADEIRRRADS